MNLGYTEEFKRIEAKRVLKENWFVKNKKADFDLIGSTFQISPILARLIVNRGVSSNEELERYLYPSIKSMHNPLKMKDLEKACDILTEKINSGKSIRVIGDYDVDGVMATYILVTGISACGGNVDYEIPDRIKDGYGLNRTLVEAAVKDGIDTIITCDNGIAAREEVNYGKESGLTMIITDHHDIPIEEGVPDADVVVNPKQGDCSYPYKGICGAAVAYKLMEILYDKCFIDRERTLEFLEFAAIATVCDVMDLADENRIIVKEGIQRFKQTKNPGLRALMEECGLLGKEINAYHFGFIIGPCINASGRLESAKTGLRMLLCKEEEQEQAKEYAGELKRLNDERKALTLKGVEHAVTLVEESSLTEDKVLVVYLPECHESLAGIIAGRLRERYNKPVLVLTKAEQGVKGSGRSIEEYNMFEELSRCKDLLNKFGGHPMAAGLSLEEDKIDVLRKRLNEITQLTEEDLILKVSFDMVLPLEQISLELIEQMARLEPYGKGNQKPVFALKDVEFVNGRLLGAQKSVARLNVRTKTSNGNYSAVYTAMIFQNLLGFNEAVTGKYGEGTFEKMLQGTVTFTMDIIFTLDINEYNGTRSIQLIIQNFR